MDRFSAHIDRAWDLISKGQGIQALVAARQALGINDESPEVHNLLGYIYALDGDIDEALSSYQRAMDLDEWYLDPVLNSAELLIYPGSNPEQAIDLCRQARDIVSGNDELVEVVLLEVDALLNAARVEEAHKKLGDLAELDDLGAAHNTLLGRAFYEAGDSENSRVFIDRAIAQQPSSADAWYYRGIIYRDEGRRIDAVGAFLTVLDLDDREPPLPWLEQLESLELIVSRAIALTDEVVQSQLSGTEIVVEPLPSREQVLRELDPRQVIFADGIDPDRRVFERLWVFSKNFFRSGVMVAAREEFLAQIIQDEVCPSRDSV